MEKIKRAYYYLFYKLYKWYEKAPVVWWSEWKAVVSIVALEVWVIACLLNYYMLLFDNHLPLGSINTFSIYLFALIVIVPNYFIFIHKKKWKNYVQKFDQLPKRTNKIGGWIIFGLISFIIINFIFSFYLYYQM